MNPNPEPDWSSAHRGMCLYISRLLRPVWDQRVAAPKSKGGPLHCRFSDQAIEVCVGGEGGGHPRARAPPLHCRFSDQAIEVCVCVVWGGGGGAQEPGGPPLLTT